MLIGLTACSEKPAVQLDHFGLPLNRPILQQQLRGYPEAGLAYPGSHLDKVVGSDQIAQPHSEEPDPAYHGAIYTAAATTPAQLYNWYAHWLNARGFHPVTYYRLTDQRSGVAWQVGEGREQVQIAIYDPKLLAAQQKITVSVPLGGLVYTELLVAYPPTR
jgi:hypothetical protein